MKVLHLTWSDRHGGAARAAFRLDAALKRAGVHSAILSTAGYLDERGQLQPIKGIDKMLARASARIDQLPLVRYPDREKALFSAARAPDQLARRALPHQADLIHLHWINNGFMKIETLPELNKPIIWTLHDMWPFTGGCHYSNGCGNFTKSCGACPQLRSSKADDLSHRVFWRKKMAWSRGQINFIAPSRWLAGVASSSALLRQQAINTLPNAIDTDAFAPTDKSSARAEFGLPGDGAVLLFGALTGDGDKRKGFHFMAPLLAKLAEQRNVKGIHLAVLGMEDPHDGRQSPFPVTYLGVLDDDAAIARAYSSADVLMVPSIEDNLPNSVLEAGSCGVPTVAFRTGGLPDMIQHRRSGYLAEPFEIEDLAAGVTSFIAEPQAASRAGMLARQHVIENYSYEVVARRHLELYTELLANSD